MLLFLLVLWFQSTLDTAGEEVSPFHLFAVTWEHVIGTHLHSSVFFEDIYWRGERK